MPAPYPLVFEPVLLPKVWGGSRLAAFGKRVAPHDTIGESWELADLASTSASGAGGSAQRSIINNGPLAGKAIRDAIALWRDQFLPASQLGNGDSFPLLIKFLDAREDLSVQVHPSPAYARAHPEAHLKTECWTVLAAEPGALLYKGVKKGVTREAFESQLRTHDGRGVVGLLEAVPAIVGQCHNLPSGTVHALGAGVLVAEVQTPSDTTYRVYDWGRTGRELHVLQALECIEWGPAPAPVNLARGDTLTTAYFVVSMRIVPAGQSASLPKAAVLMTLQGLGSMTRTGETPIPLPHGSTAFIPAGVAPGWSLVAGQGGMTILEARVPVK
jgi:mannose-6-phosphate isomerase